MIASYLNTDLPEIPREIFDVASEDADLTYGLRCEELWREVSQEMMDTEYSKRSHHNVGTYDQGCHGPLCRKANREHPRRRRGATTPLLLREERVYDPVLEYFHVVMKHRLRVARQTILKELENFS